MVYDSSGMDDSLRLRKAVKVGDGRTNGKDPDVETTNELVYGYMSPLYTE